MADDFPDDTPDQTPARISRRDTLKRIGVVGTVAWATPILSTVRIPAFAQDGTPVCQGEDFQCGGPITQCGESGEFNFCFCDVDAEGQPVCLEDAFCGDLRTCDPANGNRDCPDGSVCVPTTCCAEPVCVRLCGASGGSAGVQAQGTRSGTRASGVTAGLQSQLTGTRTRASGR